MIEIFETEHYVFHFPRNSLAAQDIRSIAETQEKGYEKICGLLQISFTHKISYWLYDSPQLIGDVFCDGVPCNGLSIVDDSDESIGRRSSLTGLEEDSFAVEPYSVHAVYEEQIKCIGEHEDTHIISAQLCNPKSAFLAEGLAMFMDGKWWGTDNKAWAVKDAQEGTLISTDEAIVLSEDDFYDLEWVKTYPVAGAWTDYIIGAYGVDKYKEFYCSKEYSESAKAVFGRTLRELHQEFVRWLDR